MKLREILSIGGKPGLYKMMKQTGNGMIVESLDDQRRFPVFAHDQISSLEEISIYTDTEDMPLRDVLKKMAEKHENGPSLNPKKASAKELKEYFLEVIPEYDEDRVYVSHIKKIIAWYNALQKNDLMYLLEEEKEEPGKEEQVENDTKE